MTFHSLQIYFLESPMTFFLVILISIASSLTLIYKKAFPVLLLHPYSIVKLKEYYRIITADLVHVDILHLLFNQAMLYIFCSNLEENLNRRSIHGGLLMLGIYLGSMLTGNTITTIINYEDYDYSSAGCSGSIMGCLFSFMILDPHGHALNEAFIGGIENLYTGLLFILALLFYKWKKKDDAINYDLHFFGALGGIAVTLLIIPFLNKN